MLLSPLAELPEPGDVIAFRDPINQNRDVLHRVIAIDDEGYLITKGDANDIADPWQLEPSNVLGSQTFTIPKVGFLVAAISSEIGILLFLVLPALAVIVSEGRIWVRYVRFGADAFESQRSGRHRPQQGRHLEESTA